jgi:hypothetical protein
MLSLMSVVRVNSAGGLNHAQPVPEMSRPVFTIFPGLKDKLDPFPIGATTFRDFAHDRAKGAKALEYTRCLDRRLLPLPGSLQQ